MNEAKALISPFTDQWVSAAAVLEATAGTVAWSRAQFERELTLPISRFFVLHEGEELLGYAGYWKVADEAQITNLVVRPDYRRKGLAVRLLRHLLPLARAEGCRRSLLEVRSRNEAALALYAKIGFVASGKRPDAYDHPKEDALLMEMTL